MRDGFSLWNMKLVGTAKRRVEEAEMEARKWKGRHSALLDKYQDLHDRLMDAEERLVEYEDRDREAADKAAARSASPVHPNTQIGGGRARAGGTDAGGV